MDSSRSVALQSARDTFRAQLGLSSDPSADPSKTGRLSGRSTARSDMSVGKMSARSNLSNTARSAQLSVRTGRSTARDPQTSSRSATFDSARTWRTEDMNTGRCEEMLESLKNTRKELQRRLKAVQEDIDMEDARMAVENPAPVKVREPVLKTRKPMFLKKNRTRKFLLKKY
ncbi:hypothetical protein TrCOL_g10684 [Triparma columacea]|uniref:Uncharacterized protein n=1 Tax=Triparma columacea TaxID=722753 RepID=A0A9W7GFV6_9STRA|nr:hypothetical protein TrCOL_g10684 [Triparma columacea]